MYSEYSILHSRQKARQKKKRVRTHAVEVGKAKQSDHAGLSYPDTVSIQPVQPVKDEARDVRLRRIDEAGLFPSENMRGQLHWVLVSLGSSAHVRIRITVLHCTE